MRNIFNQFLNRAKASTSPNDLPASPAKVTRMELEKVQALVTDLLQSREIPDFKVSVRQGGAGQILVMVEALPHPNLRHSNLMEFDIRRSAEERLSIRVGPVFWRFMIGDQNEDDTLHDAIRNHQVRYVERAPAGQPDAAASLEDPDAADSRGSPADLSDHYRPGDTLGAIEVTEISIQDLRPYLGQLTDNPAPNP